MKPTFHAEEKFAVAELSLKNKLDDLAMTAAKRSSLLCEIYLMEEAFNELLALKNKKNE